VELKKLSHRSSLSKGLSGPAVITRRGSATRRLGKKSMLAKPPSSEKKKLKTITNDHF
jgi:hypothetical protein